MPDDSELGSDPKDLGISPSERTTLKDFFAEEAKKPVTGRVGDPIIAGGQLITPKASRSEDRNPDGSINFSPARQRGLGAAISEVNSANIPDEQKRQAIQEIVDAAKQAGVSTEEIGKHLEKLGIKSQQETATPVLTEDQINFQLGYIDRIITSINAGNSDPKVLENYISYIVREQHVPEARVRELLQKRGITAIRKEDVVSKQPAYDLQKPIDGRTYNQLSARFNDIRERLQKAGDRQTLSRFEGIPIGRIFNGPFQGGDTPEARAAYYQINQLLDEIEGVQPKP